MKSKTRRLFKRLSLIFGAFVMFFTLSSCTKSFCSPLDNANQVYASFGDIYSFKQGSFDVDETTAVKNKNSIQADNVDAQNQNRKTLFNSLTGLNSTSYTYTFPSDVYLNYMRDRTDKFVNTYWEVFVNGKIASFTSNDEETAEQQARIMCKHVAIYAGFNFSGSSTDKDSVIGVSELFKNMDAWYADSLADSSIGSFYAPSAGFIKDLKLNLSSPTRSTTCITPESKSFNMNGNPIYIEGKTWGQAFKQYGFLEGLLVYPFSYIVHVISSSMPANGWGAILAILVVTIIAKVVTVMNTIFQSKTQSRQMKLQPQLAALAKKYPNSQTDPEQKRAMAMEQMQLMRKNKLHPFLPMILMIFQFPIFICVWSALQGSSALADGTWLGLSLTTTVSTCFSNYANTPGALTGIFIFIFLAISNILSSTTGLWLTSWRNKKFGNPTMGDTGGIDSNKTMKYMTYIMMIFVIIMGYSLPAGMGIYWIFGAVIAIVQSIIMELIQTRNRHKLALQNNAESELSAIRRSKHHKEKAEKKKKSDKPLWRK